jgi:hypothetical protein
MNVELWKLIASIGGVLVTTVTGPIIWAIRAEAGKIRAEMAAMEARIDKTLVEAESRLNARIDTRLTHR